MIRIQYLYAIWNQNRVVLLLYCGGYAVFAQICGVTNNPAFDEHFNLPPFIDTTPTCCEEQIVIDPYTGFDGGDTISGDFIDDCTNVFIPQPMRDVNVRLTGYYYANVSIIYSFEYTA